MTVTPSGDIFVRSDVDWPTAAALAVRTNYSIIGATCCTFVLIALFYLIVLAPLRYTAHAVIAPADQANQASAAAGLARSLGFGGAGERSDMFDEFQRTMKSEDVADEMAQRGWLKIIFSNSWDRSCNCWRTPWLGRLGRNLFASIFGGPAWHPPDSSNLYQYIDRNMNLVPVGETDMQEIQFTSSNPDVAQRFLAQAIQYADSLVRKRSQARAQASLNYLLDELRRSNQVEFRQSLMELITEQERILATVSSSQMYSARMVVSPVAFQNPSSPRVVLTLVLSLLLGAACGFIVAFVRAARSLKQNLAAESSR